MGDRYSAETDAELVMLARYDRDAFGALYDRYVTAVYHYCLRRTGNEAQAEDLTSTVFVRALERLGAVRPEAFRGWLFAVARSTVADHYRRAVAQVPIDSTGLWDMSSDEAGPEDRSLEADAERSVVVILARLPSDQRTAVELRIAGLNGREVAAAMGRSVPAVKMLQHRAARRLRGLLRAEPISSEDEP